MSGAPSEQEAHELNARLLRFRTRPEPEEAKALAEALLAAKRHGDARGVVVSAQPPEGEDAALLVLEARAWLADRDLVRAQATLLRAVRVDAAHAPTYRYLGEVLIARGDPGRAAKVLRRAVELDPGDPEAVRLATRAEFMAEAAEAAAAPPPPAPVPAPVEPPPAPIQVEVEPEQPAPTQVEAQTETPAHREDEPTQQVVAPTQVEVEPEQPAPTQVEPRAPLVSGRPSPFPARASEAPKVGVPRPPVVPAIAARPLAPPAPPAPPPPPPPPAMPRGVMGGVTPPAMSSRVPSSAGAVSAPPRSSPGTFEAPSTSPGVHPAPRTSPGEVTAPRTSPGDLAAPRTSPGQVVAPRTSPGDIVAPRTSPGVTPAPSFEEPAAVSGYEGLSTLSGDVEAPEDVIDLAEAPARAADLTLGTAAGQATDADEALTAVRAAGLFEEPASPTATWSPQSEVAATGTRVRNALIGVWLVTLLLAAGGYFGWQAWIEHRHAQAAARLGDVRAAMELGDHAALLSAERSLRQARELHPASSDVPRAALLLHCQRVLEDGQRDLTEVRSALARAQAAKLDGAAIALATAVLSAFSPDATTRTQDLDAALAASRGDAMASYLAGRLAQRMGRGDASSLLTAAAQAAPQLVPAQLALAELDLEQDERAEARKRIDAVVARHAGHLRAKLLGAFTTADERDPAATLTELDALAKEATLAAPTDKVLHALTRARALRRQGQTEAAAGAVEAAAGAGADEPRLTAWVAREALALGKLALAQRAASQALAAAPDVPAYRRLLASILLERGDGERALVLLDKLPAEDADAQWMKARAALLDGSEAALRVGLDALVQAKAKRPELATTLDVLALRLQVKLAPGAALVGKAQELVKRAPGDAEALLALAEAALAVRDPETASHALRARAPLVPGDSTTHSLLGRARRMVSDAAGAEAAYRKALELAPGDAAALSGLGMLLLDVGKYAEADAAYEQLATRGVSVLAGRLGRAEALIGLRRLDDAQVQLDAVSEAQRNFASYRLSAARLALARGKPGEAIASLRPLVEGTAKNAEVLALYGDALHVAEQVDTAAGAYEAALALDAESPEALVGRAEVHLRAERPGDALAVLETAQASLATRLRPPALRARMLSALGRAYVMRNKRGDLDSARTALRQAIALPNAPIEAYFWMGESVGGKITPEARAAYQHYLAVEPSGKYADRARRALGPLL